MREKLTIFVCENFYPDYRKIIEEEDYKDVVLVSFPCLCTDRKQKEEVETLLKNTIESEIPALAFCGEHCDLTKLLPEPTGIDFWKSEHCFSHLANESFLTYIIEKGGYLVGSGWLETWQEQLEKQGFDQETARRFYSEVANELVFFDTGIVSDSRKKLRELSNYLDLPFKIIGSDLKMTKRMIRCAVNEWRQRYLNERSKKALEESRIQTAEYAAIFDVLAKIVAYTNKRDTVGGIKNLFLMVFGAEDFKYWTGDLDKEEYPEAVLSLMENPAKSYSYQKEADGFCIKIERSDKLYGVIEVGGFFFPENTEKYLNFAIEIAMILGLVFNNIEQYEKITRSEENLSYLSFHDPMTELYNRTFINDYFEKNSGLIERTVFMFDIDRLKYVNDTFGHADGDKLIKSAAKVLERSFREESILARIGGDEFMAIIPETDKILADRILERLREEVENNNRDLAESHLALSLSAGFALPQGAPETLEALMQRADEEMYRDKTERRKKFAESKA